MIAQWQSRVSDWQRPMRELHVLHNSNLKSQHMSHERGSCSASYDAMITRNQIYNTNNSSEKSNRRCFRSRRSRPKFFCPPGDWLNLPTSKNETQSSPVVSSVHDPQTLLHPPYLASLDAGKAVLARRIDSIDCIWRNSGLRSNDATHYRTSILLKRAA